MKKRIFLFILVFFIQTTRAQKEGNNWFFGNNSYVLFANQYNPVSLPNGALTNLEGCCSISDTVGQLQFYSNGLNVWNKNNQLMPNGTGLLGNDSTTQSAIAVPFPGAPNLYYLFTLAQWGEPAGLRYSIIDMTLENGFGDITSVKNVPVITPAAEKMAVVKNAAGDGYWLVVHGVGNNSFIAYNITAAGISPTPVISNTGTVVDVGSGLYGYMKISPNGKRIISCNSEMNTELLDFDTATGIVSNPRIIETRPYCYGAEFSPSGNVAYITTGEVVCKKIYQYDLTAADIASTEYLVFQEMNNPNGGGFIFGALQLGPNGRIYHSAILRDYLSVINNPEVLGPGCNFQSGAVDLRPNAAQGGLPQFIQSYFETDIFAKDVCFGSNTQFSYTTPYVINSIVWNFGDGNTSTDIIAQHQYAAPGIYTVTANAMTSNGPVTKSKQIKIFDLPIITSLPTTENICGTTNMYHHLTPLNAGILGSQSSTTFDIYYFSTVYAAINQHWTKLLPSQYLSIGPNTFVAKIFNKDNHTCNAISSFTINLSEKPIANPVTDYVICESLPYDNIETFDLSTKNATILGTQNAVNFTISYHDSQYNADNNLNALPILYNNTFASETIYVRIQSNIDITCFATTTFDIKVIHQPIIGTITDFKLCDDNSNDGMAIFNLNQKTPEILNGQSLGVFEVKYYPNLNAAQSGTNEIINPINNSINNQQVYFVVQPVGNPLCKVISSFNLVVSKLPKAFAANPIFICDDPSNDGIGNFNLHLNDTHILGSQDSSQFRISYHLNENHANLGLNSLPLNYENTTNPQLIYARIENIQNTDCYATISFTLGLYQMPTANLVNNIIHCDDATNDTHENFDLNIKTNTILGSQSATDFYVSYYLSISEANLGLNHLSLNYQNASNPQTIYARIQNNTANECFATTSFDLIVRPKPELTIKDTYSLCEGNSITINAPSGFSSYSWSDGSLNPTATFTSPGIYTIKVTQDYGDITCETMQNISVVNSNKATITKIITQDWTDSENIVMVTVTGDGIYDYSIDGINYQNSAYFSGVRSGQHTIYVRDQNGCGITSEEIYLLTYPKFFTPNNDGFNDHWKINFSELEPNMEIEIIDRYGKLMARYGADNIGWDGMLNGYPSPSDDYWFVVKRQNGKTHKGHFALKR